MAAFVSGNLWENSIEFVTREVNDFELSQSSHGENDL